MAKCANCGKSTTFGHNRSFSQRATNRSFKPNLQKTLVMEKAMGLRVNSVNVHVAGLRVSNPD